MFEINFTSQGTISKPTLLNSKHLPGEFVARAENRAIVFLIVLLQAERKFTRSYSISLLFRTFVLTLTITTTGGLMKAVTSAKLSGSCRYALIGYGVRVGGQVPDHARR